MKSNNNYLNNTTTYLVGPIDNSPDLGMGWRQNITPKIRKLGIVVYDPTNKPNALISETKVEHDHIERLKKHNKWDDLSRFVKQIIRADLRMVDKSDFIIVYIDPSIKMCGTIHEIVIANQQKKPILAVVKGGISQCPTWLLGLIRNEEIFDSFDECLKYIEHINNFGTSDFRWVLFTNEKEGTNV